MEEYLKNRIKELEERWNTTQQKYLGATSETLANYHYGELKRIEGGLKEVNTMLKMLEKEVD